MMELILTEEQSLLQQTAREFITQHSSLRAGAGADLVFLQSIAHQPYGDGAPAVVGIRLGIVAERIQVSEIIANIGEGAMLSLQFRAK